MSMTRRIGWLLPGILAGLLLIGAEAGAARVRVSQESKPGAGDFNQNVLGHISAVLAAERTAEQFYAYNEAASWSYNGRQPALREDTSHLFFVRTREGLALFIVHDKPNDPDGGAAVTRIEVEGNSQAARTLVQDDPLGQRDHYETDPRGASFTAWHMWNPCCTDGIVTGPYAGNWKIHVRFLEPPQGLGRWTALSADGTEIRLRLEPGRRVLLEPMGFMVRRPAAPGRGPRHLFPAAVRRLW
ncbi:MAG: hypothetical protein HYU38_11050 [Candidatus Tectomicrobia bacterium]|nr:hypothetical protein [Candidatus Tectomicrobia bacterium]